MFREDLALLRCPLDATPLALREVWQEDPQTGELILARLSSERQDYLIFDGVAILAPEVADLARFSARALRGCSEGGASELAELIETDYPLLTTLRQTPERESLDELLPRWLPRYTFAALMLAKRAAARVARTAPGWTRDPITRARDLMHQAREATAPSLQGWRSAASPEAAPAGLDYLRWRTSLRSYFAVAPLLGQLDGARILDLGGGAGHLAHIVARLRPAASLVSADRSLVNLLVSRRFFLAGRRDLQLACDASAGLPLVDTAVSSVLSCDALQFFADQARCVAEVTRVLAADGQAVISCLRDQADPRARAISFGQYRSREGWRALLAPLAREGEVRLWSDDALVEACLNDRVVDLQQPDETGAASAYSFVRNPASTAACWSPPDLEAGSWRVNPVYAIERVDAEMHLTRRSWPPLLGGADVVLEGLPRRCVLPLQGIDERVISAARRQIIQPAPPRLSPRSRYWG